MGFVGEEASNDSGVVDDDIFGYFGSDFFGKFREKDISIVCSLQTKANKKAVLWQGNPTMLL